MPAWSGCAVRVDDRLAVALPPAGWVLSDDWQARRADTQQLRELAREQWRRRALYTAARVEATCGPLAGALRTTTGGSPILPVLLYAAEDLVDGVAHAGPRAFSQAHFGDTKARDDVAQILRGAGVDDDALVRLGIRRSGRLGVAGPIRAIVDHRAVALALLDGPVLIRADQPGLALSLTSPAAVVIVENLQAAETLADQRRDLGVIYTAGVPSDHALALIRQLARPRRRCFCRPTPTSAACVSPSAC